MEEADKQVTLHKSTQGYCIVVTRGAVDRADDRIVWLEADAVDLDEDLPTGAAIRARPRNRRLCTASTLHVWMDEKGTR